jgi:hypothetical protein
VSRASRYQAARHAGEDRQAARVLRCLAISEALAQRAAGRDLDAPVPYALTELGESEADTLASAVRDREAGQ